MKMGIGGVQFGEAYGIANTQGQTSKGELLAILKVAKEYEIDFIDTAPLYGSSEKTLGACLPRNHSFNIITKTIRFGSPIISAHEGKLLEVHFRRSLSMLRQKRLYALLAHDGNDLLKPGGDYLWERMTSLKETGGVTKIGISVYSSSQIERIVRKYPIDIIQLPINVLDQRLIHNGTLLTLSQKGIEIHCRSLFLQGLLLMEVENLPRFFEPIKKRLREYHSFLERNTLSAVEGAIAFVKQIKEVDCVLIGVCSQTQIREVCEAYLSCGNNELNFGSFALQDDLFLNPSRWLHEKEL